MRDLKDKWSLVTGASSGIGAEFAKQLADRGSKLVLVARREDRLEEVADSLPTESRVVAIDLLEDDAIDKLNLATTDIDIAVLVNNAGFGDYGEFTKIEPDRAVRMIQLNVQKLVELTHAFLPHMIENKHGAIINLASTSAFQAVPFMSLYAATKAFVLHFSEGLWAETRKKGVTVQALCPGFTKTEFFDQANLPTSVAFGTKSVEYVVRTSLNALDKGRQYYIPGWVNYLVSTSNRFITRRLGAINGAKMFSPKRHKQ
jgi:short-subunit dehydrogenase